MASNLPSVTYADLFPTGVSIDSKIISLWEQVQVGSGVYAVGGIPSGLQALASAKTINTNLFLRSSVESELTVPATGSFYFYKYIPTTDKLQIFQATYSGGSQTAYTELTASAIIPSGVLNDTVVLRADYTRL